MDNVRYNISPCDESEVTGFIGKIDSTVFLPNGAAKATERSHYDRYSYLCDDSRIAIVYDTTAKIVSITGRHDHAKQLLDLFAPNDKTVKRSTVPAQGSTPSKPPIARQITPTEIIKHSVAGKDNAMRAKLFVPPDRILRRNEYKPVTTVFASSKGALISTDEIYPPQTVRKRPAQTTPKPSVDPALDGDVIYPPQIIKKRVLPSYGESAVNVNSVSQAYTERHTARPLTEHGADNAKPAGISISAGARKTGVPRRAVISFGSDDDGGSDSGAFKINTRVQSSHQPYGSASVNTQPQSDAVQPAKRKRGRPPKVKAQNDYVGGIAPSQPPAAPFATGTDGQKRKRGRPPKDKAQNNVASNVGARDEQSNDKSTLEYKNGYSVKNFPPEALSNAVKRLRSYGKTVLADGTEFAGTPQEVKTYCVTDSAGQKVVLRYATKRMTLQLQGKRSELFGEVMSQVSCDTDYSSALENYIDNGGAGDKKVSDIQNKLKKRLPTAFEFLSEQSRIDFSYGIHDFGIAGLQLSDYSVLLVPAFRGLERFVFDLQRTQGINVKMIGQAYDKDDNGNYMLKSGYTQRINSVIYAEVMVALYTEYFSRRNFFAHSDNTDNNVSRSIPDRETAKRIFDGLLDVVEYNAKKLKEIGFTVAK